MKGLDRMLNDIEIEARYTCHLTGKDSLDPKVMAAMRIVPRHEFLPADFQYCAYENGPAPIGSGQTISQPYMVALMSDLLNTKSSDVILEIGTGSGYQAAILAQLVKQVYSIEIIKDLSKTASKRLKKLGYENIILNNDDGYYGWPEHAPYDGIIVTAAATHIPAPLIDQLRIGANLVIPIGLPYNYQELILVQKTAPDKVVNQKILGVSFVPLTGKH
jgi:protein-L-isoaspartate(D-aspartate) O-methyltransferase